VTRRIVIALVALAAVAAVVVANLRSSARNLKPVETGKVERRTVVAGVRNVERGLVEIREGLEAGVPVITVKAEGLKPGAQATIREAGRPS
jgi:hypothetical protein